MCRCFPRGAKRFKKQRAIVFVYFSSGYINLFGDVYNFDLFSLNYELKVLKKCNIYIKCHNNSMYINNIKYTCVYFCINITLLRLRIIFFFFLWTISVFMSSNNSSIISTLLGFRSNCPSENSFTTFYKKYVG